jgi:hypothetical protein
MLALIVFFENTSKFVVFENVKISDSESDDKIFGKKSI